MEGSQLESISNYSGISYLISELTKMSKKPSIEADLSKVLDDFLQKLNECDLYLANGIFNTNFGEAALLLQSSADLYGKKVDMLWDIIIDYQKRIVQYDEKDGNRKEEIEKLEERKRKYKRKRKVNSDENETSKLVDKFSFGCVDNYDYLNKTYDTNDLPAEWAKYNVENVNCDNQSRLYVDKISHFLPEDVLHNTEDNEYIGRYEQFHSASLIEEMFNLEDNGLLEDEHHCINQMRIDSYVINDFLREKSISSDCRIETYVNELNGYIAKFLENRKTQSKDDYVSLERLCCKESYVSLQRLPVDIVEEKLRRISTADSMFDSRLDDDISSTSSDFCREINDIDDANPSLEMCSSIAAISGVATEVCSEDTTAICQDPAVMNDFAMDTGIEESTELSQLSNKTETNGVTCEQVRTLEKRNKSCSQDSAFYDEDDMDEMISRLDTPITPFLESPIIDKLCLGSSIVIPKMVKMRSSMTIVKTKENKIKKGKLIKKRPISHKKLLKLSTGTTVSLKNFERFYALQYKSADDEGQPSQPEFSESEDSDDDDGHHDDDDGHQDDDCGHHDDNDIPDLINDNEINNSQLLISNGVNETLVQNIPELPSLVDGPWENEQISPSQLRLDSIDTCIITDRSRLSDIERTIPTGDLLDTDLAQQELSRKNVREWREFILPKLKKMENKSDFDIHEYGSKIIETANVGDTRHFKDMVAGKSSAEVARYFIATLQLANTNNLEISGALPGQLANDSFKVTLKDKTRHHELLEEYQAPSEETFRKRLEHVKAMNPKTAIHSTPLGPSPAKRMKLVNVFRKKLFEQD